MKSWNVDFKIILIAILLSLNLNSAFSQWSGLSSGTDKIVSTFYLDSINDLLYIGGKFNFAGGMNINSIATWDGQSWNAFGSNEILSTPGLVTSITKFNGEIVIAGIFDSIGNTKVNNIARWDGTAWNSIGAGLNSDVYDIIVYSGDLYACGLFAYSDTFYVSTFAKWNGSNWEQVSQLGGYGYTMTEYSGELIIGGSIHHQHSASVSGIAGWDGNSLDTTLGGFNNEIINLFSDEDTLYAVGSFTGHPGNPSNYVSVYYDNTWHSIGAPTGGPNWITDITKYHGKLYLSGYFLNPPDLCSYNGLGFDSAADVAGYISSLIVYKNELYIGGQFNQLNGQTMNNVARFRDQSNFIPDNLHSEQIEFYPNPCPAGKITIHFTITNHEREGKLQLFSSAGKLVESKYLDMENSPDLSISLQLEKGIYFSSLEFSSGRRFVNKIVVI